MLTRLGSFKTDGGKSFYRTTDGFMHGRVMVVKPGTKILMPLVIIAVSLAGMRYLWATRPAVEPAPIAEQVWQVAAAPVTLADHRPILEL